MSTINNIELIADSVEKLSGLLPQNTEINIANGRILALIVGREEAVSFDIGSVDLKENLEAFIKCINIRL